MIQSTGTPTFVDTHAHLDDGRFEGDLDAVEWYLLNHPAPTRGRITADAVVGEKLFSKIGCATCHIPDWHLHAHAPDAKSAQDFIRAEARAGSEHHGSVRGL